MCAGTSDQVGVEAVTHLCPPLSSQVQCPGDRGNDDITRKTGHQGLQLAALYVSI